MLRLDRNYLPAGLLPTILDYDRSVAELGGKWPCTLLKLAACPHLPGVLHHAIRRILENDGGCVFGIFRDDRLVEVVCQRKITPHVRQCRLDRETDDLLRLRLGQTLKPHCAIQDGVYILHVDALFMQVFPNRLGQFNRTLVSGNDQGDEVGLLNQRQADARE